MVKLEFSSILIDDVKRAHHHITAIKYSDIKIYVEVCNIGPYRQMSRIVFDV